MGKPIGLLAAGLLFLIMGLRAMSGEESEIEQTYRGETVTVICRDGEPVEGPGLDRQAAKEKCAEEDSQGSVRILLILGVMLAGWGAFELRKVRAS